jgi:hypothetical protein
VVEFMVSTRTGRNFCDEPTRTDPHEAELERPQERDRLILDPSTTGPFSPPVTQAVAESDRRETLADLRRPVM